MKKFIGNTKNLFFKFDPEKYFYAGIFDERIVVLQRVRYNSSRFVWRAIEKLNGDAYTGMTGEGFSISDFHDGTFFTESPEDNKLVYEFSTAKEMYSWIWPQL